METEQTNNFFLSFSDSPETDYINEVLNEAHEDEAKATASNQNDDWDDGLTFTAKYSREYNLFFCCVKNIKRIKF